MSVTNYLTADGSILYENRAGTEHDYVADQLGSTTALLDRTQSQTDTFAYWPYGEQRTRDGSTQTPFTFVGGIGYAQDASGIYIRRRTLAPLLGRWLQRDPLLEDRTPYSYCRCSPGTLTDYSGAHPVRPNKPVGAFGVSWKIWEWPDYGNYCGLNTACRSNKEGPIDALDAACQEHDTCLDAATSVKGSNAFWTSVGLGCDVALLGNVRDVVLQNKCAQAISPVDCELAAMAILTAFGVVVIPAVSVGAGLGSLGDEVASGVNSMSDTLSGFEGGLTNAVKRALGDPY